MTSTSNDKRFPALGGFGALFGLRAMAGVVLLFWLAPISVDDYFRVFHALWWWDNPNFTTSHDWLPGYTYVYGLWVGLTGDTLLAPRLLSLAFHLGAGVALAVHRGLPSIVRWLAAIWLLTPPLALVLGSVPLTEALATCLLVVGIVSLSRFLDSGKSPYLLVAASVYLGAAMTRFDAWALLPVFSFFALTRKPERYFEIVNRVLAFLPWFFPLVWTVLLWVYYGEPFTYFGVVREDHFGAGDLFGSLATPLGAATLVQLVLAVAVFAVAVVDLIRGRRALRDLLWEAHGLAALAFVAVVVVRGDVPSQFPLRMLYPTLLFASVPLARLLVNRVSSAVARLGLGAAAGALLLGLGTLLALGLPSGVEDDSLRAAERIGRLIADGEVGPDGHVLVERSLPDGAAVLVFSNESARVHIDAVGGDCPARLLGPLPLVCPVEPWSGDVEAVLIHRENVARELEGKGWRQDGRFGYWTLFLRPPGAPSLIDGLDLP